MKKEYVGPRYDHIANMPFEIQVRTIAMDAWANVSHYLEYKSETDVPSDLRRDFYALSGLFYVADKHFEMFFRSRAASREQLAEAFAASKPPLDQEINLDSLAEYLANKFSDRKHVESRDLSELISELSDIGVRRIAEVDREVDRGLAAFEIYEQEHPPLYVGSGGLRRGKYSDLGVVRVIFMIASEKYRELKKTANPSIKRDYASYERFLK
jgi:hypothetical protein